MFLLLCHGSYHPALYKTTMCKTVHPRYVRAGGETCKHGDACSYAHTRPRRKRPAGNPDYRGTCLTVRADECKKGVAELSDFREFSTPFPANPILSPKNALSPCNTGDSVTGKGISLEGNPLTNVK